MNRYKDIIKELNMYERSLNKKNNDEEALMKRKELLSLLSKSGRFKEVYEMIKREKLNLNYFLLPYRAYRDEKGVLVYKIKTYKELQDDYAHALLLLEGYHYDRRIDKDQYKYLKEHFEIMKDNFIDEFKNSKIDELTLKEKVNYDIYKLKIKKKYQEYLSLVGSEAMYEKIKAYEECSTADKCTVLYEQSELLKRMLNVPRIELLLVDGVMPYYYSVSEEDYRMRIKDVDYYSLDILAQEQIYKISCGELLKNNVSTKVVEALLEDVDFIKSNYTKADNNPEKTLRKK